MRTQSIIRGLFKFFLFITPLVFISCNGFKNEASNNKVGEDLIEAFARAEQGKPLRYVAIGGSITEGGKGWIGNWLREQFPHSPVFTFNAGISGTGSDFASFRLERDVIANQPDIVAIEFCVNDGSRSDATAIRYMESLIIRLKQLPNPPAIFIIESASRSHISLLRHRKVAQHYGLFEVDLQKAVDEKLAQDSASWESLFRDHVHPNEIGHDFYRKTLIEKLQPFVDAAKKEKAVRISFERKPSVLSEKPLLLDGRLVRLGDAPGWSREDYLPYGWTRHFMGYMTSSTPGATYVIPFRGTTVGLFYALDKDYGSFYASVDGEMPVQISCNVRTGFGYKILAEDMEACEHLLTVVLPPTSKVPNAKENGPVKLGLLMVGGESNATRKQAKQGIYTAEVIRSLDFTPIIAPNWKWAGPYPTKNPDATDAGADIQQVFPPETQDTAVVWQTIGGSDFQIDYRKITKSDKACIAYAETHLNGGEKGKKIFLRLSVDYFAKLWLNGELVASVDGPHGPALDNLFYPVTLKPGDNRILVKTGAGSMGHIFTLSTNETFVAP